MYHISSYLYDNRIQVLLLDEDPLLKTRNRIVYSRELKIYNNIDNVVTILFKNSDQKSANISGKTFTFSIIDEGLTVWAGVVTANASAATGQVTINQANVANLTSKMYNYTISYTGNGNLTLPAYVDDNYGAAGQLHVISNVF